MWNQLEQEEFELLPEFEETLNQDDDSTQERPLCRPRPCNCRRCRRRRMRNYESEGNYETPFETNYETPFELEGMQYEADSGQEKLCPPRPWCRGRNRRRRMGNSEFEGNYENGGIYTPNSRLGFVKSTPRDSLNTELNTELNTKIYPNSRLGFVMSVPRSMSSMELEDFEREIVGPHNELKPVLDTTQVPFRWICHLDLNFGPDPNNPGNDLHARGTGTLISPRHVLTCGHNLFNDELVPGLPPREVKKIKVTPGYNCAGKIAAPFGSAHAIKKVFHSKWKATLDNQFDYGLITLNKSIGNASQKILGNKPLGYWGDKTNGADTRINPQTTAILKDKKILISGYPGIKCCYKDIDPAKECRDSMWAGAQFWSYGKITNASPAVAPNIIFYDADTSGGHSGSPGWIVWQQYRNLVSIHTGPAWPIDPALRRIANRGVRITDDVMKNVQRWM